MQRRDLLKIAASGPLWAGSGSSAFAAPVSRARPGDFAWPSATQWERLGHSVNGHLLKLESPFAHCASDASGCSDTLQHLKNSYYLGDQPALTQTSGWANAWASHPSAYAVAARSTADVVAAVRFARQHNLRLVVKGGGHSYQGASCAPDSLLVWTRPMNQVSVHDAFVAHGCEHSQSTQPAVTLEAGAMWIDAYDAVTTRAGRYVQGGGCATVGVAGLIQGGGFGSFSKNYGTASAGLLQAEIVTADGEVRIANECSCPDLFWALKGGGGGTFGVVTRVTLRTRDLPQSFGAVYGAIKADSDNAYRALIARAMSFYHSDLFNPHWGEQMVFQQDNTLRLAMLFQGLSQQQAQSVWAPFADWVKAQPGCQFSSALQIVALPARQFWNAEFLSKYAPNVIVRDDRPDAPGYHYTWAGDQSQAGWFLHGYKSAWLPASLLNQGQQSTLVDALFAATRHWEFALHFNKGLAGAPAEEIAAARNTAANPALLDAFALAIAGAEGAPAYPGMPGPAPDLAAAQDDASQLSEAFAELLRLTPQASSYLAESDYFERDWQRTFWGHNYTRLAQVKRKYDPAGLFFVHHGVGSESWSADGFTRIR